MVGPVGGSSPADARAAPHQLIVGPSGPATPTGAIGDRRRSGGVAAHQWWVVSLRRDPPHLTGLRDLQAPVLQSAPNAISVETRGTISSATCLSPSTECVPSSVRMFSMTAETARAGGC